jgi:hypothetical protein
MSLQLIERRSCHKGTDDVFSTPLCLDDGVFGVFKRFTICCTLRPETILNAGAFGINALYHFNGILNIYKAVFINIFFIKFIELNIFWQLTFEPV